MSPECGELSEHTDSAHTEEEDLSVRYMNGSDTNATQDNFILPASPVGGLPISQDRCIGYTNLGMRQIQCRLGSKFCPLITPNANMVVYPTNFNVFFCQNVERHTFVSPSQSRDVPAAYIVKLGDTKVSL